MKSSILFFYSLFKLVIALSLGISAPSSHQAQTLPSGSISGTGKINTGVAHASGVNPGVRLGGTAGHNIGEPSGTPIWPLVPGLISSGITYIGVTPSAPTQSLANSNESTTQSATTGLPIPPNAQGTGIAISAPLPVALPSIIKSIIVSTVSGSPVTESASFIFQSGLATPVPLAATVTLDPGGTIASSSASSLGSQLIFATSAVSDYLTASTDSTSKTAAIGAVQSAEAFGTKFHIDLGGGGGGGGSGTCSSQGLLGDLLGAVSCAVSSLDRISGHIKGGLDDTEHLSNDLKDLGSIAANLPRDPANKPEDNNPSGTQQQSTVLSTTNAPTSTSGPSSCTAAVTATDCDVVCNTMLTSNLPSSAPVTRSCSTTCSTTAGCSATGKTSTTVVASACSFVSLAPEDEPDDGWGTTFPSAYPTTALTSTGLSSTLSTIVASASVSSSSPPESSTTPGSTEAPPQSPSSSTASSAPTTTIISSSSPPPSTPTSTAPPSPAPTTTTAPPPPSPTPTDADDCTFDYKALWDTFDIRGKNFDTTEFGDDGSGLHDQVSGCGSVTKWGFEWTPDDTTYDWHAWGRLPIGAKDCVGRAIVSAGGADGSTCHGSG